MDLEAMKKAANAQDRREAAQAAKRREQLIQMARRTTELVKQRDEASSLMEKVAADLTIELNRVANQLELIQMDGIEVHNYDNFGHC